MTENLARALHPPRLPEAFAAPGIGDFLAAFGLGLIFATLILTLAMPALRRRQPVQSLRSQLAKAATLPAQERSLALARIAATTGRPLPPDLQQALYSRAGADPARIEALIRAGSTTRLLPGRGRP